MIGDLLRDLRYGARLLRRNGVFAGTAMLSLAFGIGGATAVFTLVNAIVLRTLPVPEPRELYFVQEQTPAGGTHEELFSVPMFERARDQLAAMGAGELTA